MRKALFLLLFCGSASFAQTFSNINPLNIPNNNTDLSIPITVSGLPGSITSSFGLGAICLNISHEYTADLIVSLKSPDGTLITLADSKGGSSDGYPGTCFMENGTDGWIHLASPPFTGIYIPQASLNLFNNGMDPNGIWELIIRDVFTPSDTGTFHYVNISFMFNPPPDPTSGGGPCSAGNPGGCHCPDGVSTACELLPDMTSSALCIQNDHTEYPGHITLANATPNIGYGPLEIHGTGDCYCDTVQVPCSTSICPDGSDPRELITQRVYQRNNNAMYHYDRPAGTMSFHPSHGHVHVDNWAEFTLRRATSDLDARTWPVIGEGTKVSFCLVNLGDCDSDPGYCVDTLGNVLTKADIPNSDFGTVSGCSRDQGIYVGNLDIYSSGLNGMGIILPPNTCNGDYFIVSITDPQNNMLELNEDNNWVAVPITLSQQNAGSFLPAGFVYTVSGNTANMIANAAGADSLVWNWGDGSAQETTTNILLPHTFPGPGDYIVRLSAYNVCGPTVTIDTITILPISTGIISHTQLAALKVFPNPSKQLFTVSYVLNSPGEISISLSDIRGRQLYRNSLHQEAGKHESVIDTRSLAMNKGIYFLQIMTPKGIHTERLVLH
jgi:subtilisin-like proprotein convertase family protein